MDRIEAAVLVADISGFTKLTESMGSREVAGVELLTKCVNSFFGQVIDLVLCHGGDVMQFAGDSMICCFTPTTAEQGMPGGGLKQATIRCLQCATALTRNLGEHVSLPFITSIQS